MAAVYAVIAITVTWMVLGALGVIPDKAPSYSILLFCSNFVQLALMFVILTGQGVMSRMSDKRAEDTYQDAESLLHEAEQVQAHLAVQDQDLKQLLTHAQALVVHLEGMTAPE